jgi:S1-C subfamily serine protease
MNRPARFRLEALISMEAAALAVLLFIQTAHPYEVRTWKSAKGNYSLEAELLELQPDGKVRLKRKNGTTVEVPLDRLSPADQKYAREHAAALGNPPAPAATAPTKTPDDVEKEALDSRTAKEAVLIYKFYLAQPSLTPQERAAAMAKLKEWDEKVAKDQVRLGKKWISKTEADEFRKQAKAKIESALEYLRLGNGELSRKTLEEASKLDPDSIQADFLMGVVYGLVDNDRKSQIHFEKCLKRDPGNVSVLNNLAVSLVFQKKYPQAAQHWKTAAASAPKMRALSQNIGSLITMAGSPQYRVPDSTMKELSALYEELITKHGNPRPAEIGFVLTPPYGSDWEEREGGGRGKGKSESVVVSSGSGFVVHPHVILTNEHVVKGASGLLVLNPKDPRGDPLPAELIAVSDKFDLALVRCESLDAPPLTLTEKLPGRGTDIMVLGYPLGPSFGTTLKSTRGAMVAMPDPSLENMFLYDAITNPGNSGGPLCDKSGRVAGVVRAVTGGVGGTYGAGIPISDAIPFIRQHISDLAAVSNDAEEVDWPAVDAMVAPSTVLILTKEDLRTDAVGENKRK